MACASASVWRWGGVKVVGGGRRASVTKPAAPPVRAGNGNHLSRLCVVAAHQPCGGGHDGGPQLDRGGPRNRICRFGAFQPDIPADVRDFAGDVDQGKAVAIK